MTKKKKIKQSDDKAGKGSEQTFSQRRRTDGQQAHERYLTSVTVREMQIRTMMRLSPRTC